MKRKEPIHLTEASVARLKFSKGKDDETWFDDKIKGFGVRKRGDATVYILQYQLNGKTSKLTLGRSPELRCDVARELANAKRGEISRAKLRLGTDPATERESTKAEAKKPKPQTFEAALADYMDDKRSKFSRRHFAGANYQLGTLLQPLHKLPVREIKLADVAPILRAITKKHGEITANRSRGALSAFYRWSIGEGLCDNNPVVGTNQHKEKPRDRVLIEIREDGSIDWSELVSIWQALPEDDYGRIIKLLTLTGCRREEIGDLRWDEIKWEDRAIILPPERTKNKNKHVVPLSKTAYEILESIPRRERAFVFGIGQRGLQDWTKPKAKLDNIAQLKTPWTPHDLRRTIRTGLGRLGVLPHVAEAVLNHLPAKLIRTYDRNDYTAEKRAALELWASELAVAIAQANGENVVRLKDSQETGS